MNLVPDSLSQTGSPEFWNYLDQLAANHRLVIDRPQGSHHPRIPEVVYPYDYGYLDGTSAADGAGIDVWRGSLASKTLDAVALTVDLHKQDAELKLLLGCTEAEKQHILDFLNRETMRAVLIHRQTPKADWLKNRRSVRRFLDRAIPQPVLERILEAATWAPSAHNRQPWRFAVLTTLEAKTRLADRMGAEFQADLLADGLPEADVEAQVQRSRSRIIEAPAVIVLSLDPSAADTYPDPRRQQAEYTMGVQGVAMAGQNLLLAAWREGLGGVWICAPLFAPEAVRLALSLPETWQPQGLVLLGYPAKVPPARERKPAGEVSIFL